MAEEDPILKRNRQNYRFIGKTDANGNNAGVAQPMDVAKSVAGGIAAAAAPVMESRPVQFLSGADVRDAMKAREQQTRERDAARIANYNAAADSLAANRLVKERTDATRADAAFHKDDDAFAQRMSDAAARYNEGTRRMQDEAHNREAASAGVGGAPMEVTDSMRKAADIWIKNRVAEGMPESEAIEKAYGDHDFLKELGRIHDENARKIAEDTDKVRNDVHERAFQTQLGDARRAIATGRDPVFRSPDEKARVNGAWKKAEEAARAVAAGSGLDARPQDAGAETEQLATAIASADAKAGQNLPATMQASNRNEVPDWFRRKMDVEERKSAGAFNQADINEAYANGPRTQEVRRQQAERDALAARGREIEDRDAASAEAEKVRAHEKGIKDAENRTKIHIAKGAENAELTKSQNALFASLANAGIDPQSGEPFDIMKIAKNNPALQGQINAVIAEMLMKQVQQGAKKTTDKEERVNPIFASAVQ